MMQPDPNRANRSPRTGVAESIAIVGMACRFPGADGPAEFWRRLAAGADLISEGEPGSGVGRVGRLFPDTAERRPACRFGAYLDDLELFDAPFFRISPVEAQMLDPQQRLMLETSWRALEDAAIDPERLAGSRTGVYAGISNNEYRSLIMETSDTSEPAASLYTVTGTSYNTAIGRVAFALGLEGPAIAVDTACSSSLVALHQAVSGLQRGESDLALAGGVHTILSGRLLELRANAGMLSPDGRCKTFDAAANGYVRGEGCGILVLKRLADAEADGDRIWAVVRATALNQDGASPGLTVPSGPAQERVIEAALRRAGIEPADVDYVEAHGTGTEVGDPVEANATGAVYGRGRDPDRPLLIGSVKTNIGHLESAAGVAGVMKVVLAMQQGMIPPHLHFRNPSPQMDWERLPLRVTAEATPWPVHDGHPPLAGVSGFGWSGTNAHVVLEGYASANGRAAVEQACWASGPARSIAVTMPGAVVEVPGVGSGTAPRTARFLPLSGKSEAALRDLARGYLGWLDDHGDDVAARGSAADAPLSDLAWTAGVGRSHFVYRAGVVFQDAATLRDGLRAVADPEAGAAPRTQASANPKVAFAFTGQASQWPGMGETLYASEPVVRAVLDRCDALLRAERGASLLDVMFGRPDAAGGLDEPAWKQPAIYALECALAALWRSLGIVPEVVVGHSLGEIAAAQTAGVFSLEDGLRFAAARGALIGALPEAGAMAVVFAPAERVAAAVAEHNASAAGIGLCVAVDNGSNQVVSGPAADVAALLERFEAEQVRVRLLRNSPAYHSALVEPALDKLEAALQRTAFAAPSIPLVSNLSGRLLDPGSVPGAAYWRRHAREKVQFRQAVETLAELGTEALVEIGPHAVLGPMAMLAWPPLAGGPPVVLASLRRPSRDTRPGDVEDAFTAAVAGAYEAGLPVRFDALFAGEERRRISLPGYPFQRQRHWIPTARRRRTGAGHPLLGERHESARGEVAFDTELLAGEPAWLSDHRVFGRLLVPGAWYGAMAVAAAVAEGDGAATVAEMQLHNPLLLPEGDAADGSEAVSGRKVQVLLDPPEDGAPRRAQILSKGVDEEGWTLHAEAQLSSAAAARSPDGGRRVDLEALRANLAAVDVSSLYRAKAGAGIELGPAFRTLQAVWSRPGEAVAEVVLPAAFAPSGVDVHPLLLDGCFQVVAAARSQEGAAGRATYLPFGFQRLWLAGALPERLICHVRMAGQAGEPDEADMEPNGASEETAPGAPPEVLTAEMRIHDPSGAVVGELNGYLVKRATRAALLSAVEGVQDLLYEVVWRDRALPPGMPSAGFLTAPSAIAAGAEPFTTYLAAEQVSAEGRAALLADLERLARCYALAALDKLGWRRSAGESVDADGLRQRLQVSAEHARLFRRMLEMVARGGVLDEQDDRFVVTVGSGEPLPDDLPPDPEQFAAAMAGRYAHGDNEIGLFRRSGGSLPDVLRGNADPLTLLFSSGEPSAADLYRKAPVARAANRMLADAVAALLQRLPEGRRLRVIEVGAGTGSATAAVLPELPAGRYDYTYTDISAGFFAEAEASFGGSEAAIEYRVLDIEHDPVAQGFNANGYDLVIASNVLHATRYLHETLAHCRALLAPSGQLVALENLRGQGWLDLTFGQLDGWWRFADDYRPHHALASPEVWRRALGDSGFTDAAVLGVPRSDAVEQREHGSRKPDRGVIVAQGPAEVAEQPGAWVLAADRSGLAARLAGELAARNQTVVLATAAAGGGAAPDAGGVSAVSVEMERRDAWRGLLEALPGDVPLAGVVHLAALDGHGVRATTVQMAQDTQRAAASALALVQGLADADLTPSKGVWFVTRGAQVLDKERAGELAGATLWGVGKVIAREAAQLQARMIDLDPEPVARHDDFTALAEELLYPDRETHVAYRTGRRQAARLVRAAAASRLPHPEQGAWLLEPDPAGVLEGLRIDPLPARALEPRQVRLAVEAAGLNFWDVFRAIGLVDAGLLGGEACGRVLEVGSEVTEVEPGDLVVALAFGTFGSEVVTRVEMVARAPAGIPVAELATMPTAFVSALLSYDEAQLQAGERVLIHAGAGGVGLAAIQLAQAAGAEVFATASAPKQAYLRSLGVRHVFDSRSTSFGREVLAATGGDGVDVVLNSLTGEGFIDASLSCLARGGRFVELARVDILSEEEMAAARPDVAYTILKLDVLKEHHPAVPGDALRRVMARLAAGEVRPLVYSRWPLTEAGPAMNFMRAARHLGKIVLAASPLERGRLRAGRTFLVTGGLGGIGCAVAGWLADRGAEAIVLNGRRAPAPDAEEAIASLRDRGVTVRVELADVTDAEAVDAILARIDRELPPLGGVIHSVGVLADAALGNQSWETFEQVLWPKMLGAWHLHRATEHRELELFLLFSSIVGTMGNAGQANHAAANAFLDQLAAHRRARGLPGQAIAWGAWSGLGEAEEQRERIARQRSAFGGGWFTPQQGLRALDRLVRDDPATAAVMAMDWPVFAEAIERRPPLLEELLAAAAESDDDTASEADDLPGRVRAAPAAEREGLLVSFLQREVQAVLRLPSAPAPEVGFFELGMDSLMAVELRNRLNRACADAYSAPNTLVFDYPDIATLARHLAAALGDGAAPGIAAAGSDPAAAATDGAGPPVQAVAADPAPPATARPAAAEPASSPPAAPPATGAAAAPTRAAAESMPQGSATVDAIAIVGMACRFPGAPDLAAFAHMLEDGGDAVTDGRPDADPGSDAPGLPVIRNAAFRRGGFVTGIDRFDARFFGVSPIEARMMDPRQRMLLEASWQALEDAAIDPEGLRGSRTGVYVGVSASEYRDLMTAGNDIVSYLSTAGSMTVGRVSFLYGLAGPTMPVELNCASSLVAVHQAAAGLHAGEVDLALVGGVHANLSPAITLEMAELGLLSPTGHCAPFSAAADGFVRGEGCGLVVLKRLADARADGDRIWAVIRGSSVNQNGASAGPTVPNGPAQERVIAEALARAGVEPADVDYLEAHGAGSSMGDAIEVQAAAAVYGRDRAVERPLLIGSVKTSIGHLEPAGGIAGLIRAVLAINRGVIPPHLHFHDPSPDLDWDRLPVRVTTELTSWPASPGRPRRAGVSALGISGANAHVVVEGHDGEAGDAAATRRAALSPAGSAQPVLASLPDWARGGPSEGRDLVPRRTRLLPLSGKSGAALRALAERYLGWLDERADELADGSAAQALLADVAWTAGVGRSHFPHRAAILFHDPGSLRAGLQALAGTDAETDAEPRKAAKAAFAYSGQAGPWLAAARVLYESEPVVRAVLDRCEEALWEQRGASLLEVMCERPGATGHLDRGAWTPPAVFALQCALTALWSSVGIRPAAVLGERLGELAAAQAAGMVDGLEEGLRLAASTADGGTSADGAAAAPAEFVLVGGTLPLISAATGRIVESGTSVNGERWRRLAGEPIAAGACLRTLADLQVDAIVEIAPQALPGSPADGGAVSVIRASDQPDGAFAAAVAAAYEAGLPVSFAGLFAGEARRRISLPTYPFQRRRHWIRMR